MGTRPVRARRIRGSLLRPRRSYPPAWPEPFAQSSLRVCARAGRPALQPVRRPALHLRRAWRGAWRWRGRRSRSCRRRGCRRSRSWRGCRRSCRTWRCSGRRLGGCSRSRRCSRTWRCSRSRGCTGCWCRTWRSRRAWRSRRSRLAGRRRRSRMLGWYWPLRRLGHFGYVHQLDIEDQVRFGRDTGVVRRVARNVARSVGKLPGNEEPALAANLHSGKSLVKAGDQAAIALREGQGLHVHLRLSIGPHHRFAVFARHRGLAVGVRIELLACRRKVSRVVHVVHHVGLSLGSSADLDVFKAQRKVGFDDAASLGNRRRQLQPPIRGGAGHGF